MSHNCNETVESTGIVFDGSGDSSDPVDASDGTALARASEALAARSYVVPLGGC